MSTKLPRLNVVLEQNTYRAIKKLSKREGMSLSLIARDLIREALDTHEDIFWAKEAKKRESTFQEKKTLTHNQIWKK